MTGERELEDVWTSLGDELGDENASNTQGPELAPITGVRPANSITDQPPALPTEGDPREQVSQVIRFTRPFAPSLEKPVEASSVTRKKDIWSNAPAAFHTPTIPAAKPDDSLPIETDLTPLRSVHPLYVRESVPPRPNEVFDSVNALMAHHVLATALRAPTKVMDRETRNSLGSDRPRSDAPPARMDNDNAASLEELAAKTVPSNEENNLVLEPTSYSARTTILPNDQITAATPLIAAMSSSAAFSKPIRLESIIINDVPVLATWQEMKNMSVADPNLLETPSDRFITDPKEPWWKRWGNKIKETATAISTKVRETLSEIFTFRTSTRRAVLGILAGATLGTIATMQHEAPTTEAHQEAPVVHVQTTAPTNVPVVDTMDQQVIHNPDQTPLVVHAATVTVDEHSSHITFVQALTQFLTSNRAHAKLANYNHHTGDAIRILHSLEQNTDIADTAYHLRHHTHRGDRFHFAVMSDGSIQLDHWHGRHSQSNKLPTPITFRLPQR